MTEPPVLETDRLILRPFCQSDAKDVAKYAGDYDVYKMTLRIPHPYNEHHASEFFAIIQAAYENGQGTILAIVPKSVGHVIGAIGLEQEPAHDVATLGFWIGKPFWGQGYCTEAARRMLLFGFQELELNCVHASHFCNNPASGKVMKKLGMTHEGTLRQRYKKLGEYIDVESYSILKEEFCAAETETQEKS